MDLVLGIVFTMLLFYFNLWSLAAGMSDMLCIHPPGPIVSPPGATLVINCTLTETAESEIHTNDIKWSVPVNRTRFSIRNEGLKTRQLVIANLKESDAGMFICKYKQKAKKSVRVWVMSSQDRGNGSRGCSDTQFQCSTGHCIFMRYRCDRIGDCPDSSDELGCSKSCEGKYMCENGQCVAPDRVCDELQSKDCRDGSDEKYCDRITEFLDEFVRNRNSRTDTATTNAEHNHVSWRFNAIYSGVAGLVGLVCVAAIVTLTVFRIHMHKKAARLQQCRTRELVQNSDTCMSTLQEQTCHLNINESAYVEDIPPHRCPASTNLALNINLCVCSPDYQALCGVQHPPPYSEEVSQTDSLLPPPYSTIDRHGYSFVQNEDGNANPPPYSTLDRQSDLTSSEI